MAEGVGGHRGGEREGNWEAAKLDAYKMQKAAPEDGLCHRSTRGMDQGSIQQFPFGVP